MGGNEWFATFQERLQDLRDEATLHDLPSIAEHLHEAWLECSIPPEVQLIYSLMMEDMFGDQLQAGALIAFPADKVKRIILTGEHSLDNYAPQSCAK
jgi:hypothetical protein